MRILSLLGVTVSTGLLLFGPIACSRSQNGSSHVNLVSVNDREPDEIAGRDARKSYDSKTLVEQKEFAGIPSDVRDLLEKSIFSAGGEGPNGKCCAYLVGGFDNNNALVAFEGFGFVPNYRAIAYVHIKAGWVKAGGWEIGPVSTLVGLKEMTDRPPDFW